MLIGVITDIHLAPPGHPAAAFHNPYAFADAAERFQRALERCLLAGADMIAILGDVSDPGDDSTLSHGVSLAAAAGRPVWLVAGNHDVGISTHALAQAVTRLNADQVRMATPGGQEIGESLRLAGVSLGSGLTVGEPRAGALDVADWRDDIVILLSHYPMRSLREKAAAAGLRYAGDLDGMQRAAEPLLSRAQPTIVLNGHIHLRHTEAHGPLLQISCSALIEPPYAVAMLDVTWSDGQITVRHREESVAPIPDVQIPRLSAPNQTWRFADGAWQSDGR